MLLTVSDVACTRVRPVYTGVVLVLSLLTGVAPVVVCSLLVVVHLPVAVPVMAVYIDVEQCWSCFVVLSNACGVRMLGKAGVVVWC